MTTSDQGPAADNRPSSTQQLGKMIVVTPPSLWVAIIGAVLIIAAFLAWSCMGRLPVNLSAEGIYINLLGTGGIHAPASGYVTKVPVRTDADVQEGDVIAVIDTQVDGCDDDDDKVEITAPASGTISSLHIEVGSYVNIGDEVARIRYNSEEYDDSRIVVLYVPFSSVRQVRPDMKVMIYPSTVNRQEYGHMEAEVLYIDNYVATTENLLSMLGDQQLVDMFTANGPVAQVYCTLRSDESTASGYYWSSNQGASVELVEGTTVEADIVLSERAPISILFPYLGTSN